MESESILYGKKLILYHDYMAKKESILYSEESESTHP